MKDAVRSAKEDRELEKEMDSCSLKSGEIRITMNMKGGVPVSYTAQGAGIRKKNQVDAEKVDEETRKRSVKVTPAKEVPAIASKSVKAEDVYKVCAGGFR